MEGWAICHMEGCTFPDSGSPIPGERRAAIRGEPKSVCMRCGRINYALRTYLALRTRKKNQKAK